MRKCFGSRFPFLISPSYISPSYSRLWKLSCFLVTSLEKPFYIQLTLSCFLHVHLQKKPHAHTHTPVHSSPTNYSPASSPSSNYQSITKPSAHTQNPNVWLKLCKVRNHCTKSLQFLSNSLPGFGDIFRNIWF